MVITREELLKENEELKKEVKELKEVIKEFSESAKAIENLCIHLRAAKTVFCDMDKE